MAEMIGNPTEVECGHTGYGNIYFRWVFPDKDDRPVELYLCKMCYDSLVGNIASDVFRSIINDEIRRKQDYHESI